MSKVVSANITAGIAASSVPQFLVEIESANTLYRWATFPCNSTSVSGWTGPDFESKIAKKGLGKIRRAIDISEGGNVSQVQKWSVKILNQALISDTLATENFIGRRAEIRLIFTDQTGPSWMNAVPIAPVGFIEDITWDEDTVTFHVSDGPLKKHRDLPKRILTRAEFSSLPRENEGKPIPLWYGDFTTAANRSGIASDGSSAPQDIIHRDYAKGYLLSAIQRSGDQGANNPRAVLCSHDVIPLTGVDLQKFGFNDARGLYHRTNVAAPSLSGDSFGSVHSGLKTIGVYQRDLEAPDPEFPGWNYFDLIPVVDALTTSAGTENAGNAVDEDDANYARINAAGEIAAYEIPATFGTTDRAGKYCDLYFWIDQETSYTLGDVTYTVERDGETTLGPTNVPLAAIGTLYSIEIGNSGTGTGFDLSTGDHTGIRIKFTCTTGARAFRIRLVYLRVAEQAQSGNPAYILETGKGRMFDSWIDSPDHSNAFNSGDLIQNPAYAIESLLVDELGLKVKRHGAAIQFQDSGASTPFFQAPDSASLQLAGIVSIECWVKFISFVAAGENFIVAKIDAGGDIAPYALSVSTGGKIRFWRGDGTTSNYLESSATLSTGTWYHIVATAAGGSGATRYIHINGAYDNGSSIIQAVADGGNVLRIGLRAGATTRTNMILDELRIWDRVITEGEAKQLYNGGSGYPRPYYPSNTKAWWRFDEEGRLESDGSTPGAAINASDSSGNGNTAASNNHTNMRWVTGTSAKIPYTESEVQENDSTTNAQSSFDIVAATRSSWLFARDYLDKANSINMIREACKEAHIGFFTNYLGEDTVARIDGGATGYAPTTLSNFRLQGEKSSVSVKRGALKHWYNEFVLHYKVNVVTGEPEETLFVNTPDGAAYSASYTNLTSEGEANWDLCAAAYVATLQVNRWEYTAQNIRDAATAELFLKAVIAHLTRRPYIVSEKSGLSRIIYELLDLVKISHPLLPAAVSGINRFRLIEQEIDCNECELASTYFDVGVVNEEPS